VHAGSHPPRDIRGSAVSCDGTGGIIVSNILRSVASELRLQFGRRWPISVIVLIAVAFWPIPVYWNRIQFVPATFVQEYVKATCTGLLLWLVLRIAAARRERRARAEHIREVLANDLVSPLGKMIRELNLLDNGCSAEDRKELQKSLRSAWEKAKPMLDVARPDSPLGAVRREYSVGLPESAFRVGRIDCLVVELARSGASSIENRAEYDELRSLLASLLAGTVEVVAALANR
jgi:hypothetical protein